MAEDTNKANAIHHILLVSIGPLRMNLGRNLPAQTSNSEIRISITGFGGVDTSDENL